MIHRRRRRVECAVKNTKLIAVTARRLNFFNASICHTHVRFSTPVTGYNYATSTTVPKSTGFTTSYVSANVDAFLPKMGAQQFFFMTHRASPWRLSCRQEVHRFKHPHNVNRDRGLIELGAAGLNRRSRDIAFRFPLPQLVNHGRPILNSSILSKGKTLVTITRSGDNQMDLLVVSRSKH